MGIAAATPTTILGAGFSCGSTAFPQGPDGREQTRLLVDLCGACNSEKGDRTMEALIADLLAAQIRLEISYRRVSR